MHSADKTPPAPNNAHQNGSIVLFMELVLTEYDPSDQQREHDPAQEIPNNNGHIWDADRADTNHHCFGREIKPRKAVKDDEKKPDTMQGQREWCSEPHHKQSICLWPGIDIANKKK